MRNAVVMALVAALALGAGVMGTLTWVENQDRAKPQPLPTAAQPPLGAAPGLDPMAAADAASRARAAQAAAGGSGEANGAPGGTSGNNGQPPVSVTQGKTGPEATLAVANWYFDEKRWPEAIELYRATIAGGIDNPDVRTDLGSALRFGGKPEEALVQYQIAHRQDPKHELSLFNQGGLYAFALNDPQKALVAWKAYLKAFPTGSNVTQTRQFIQQFSGTKPKPNKK